MVNMNVLLMILAIAVIVSWIIAIRALKSSNQGNRATNTMIIAAVLTTLFLMLLFISRG
ncbi:hypothetical protein [Staphylococcus americanisciuri]|uniref:Mid2-like cell wall stress sensor domain protein n=1 Tax=Staphylococcus americanisciuri TaxID=2973940 RepID=A0ABT2F5M1_9STAP|nr:hypothetical protein [Staphylococcus americanisciuri]MCS4487092.1 hypothetical protein [Staphylococcus americanisciuri]